MIPTSTSMKIVQDPVGTWLQTPREIYFLGSEQALHLTGEAFREVLLLRAFAAGREDKAREISHSLNERLEGLFP